ncbi:MAG: hypothetical protein GY832_23490 [Chloroflexi bacterium]|nr:hypothetical protein [Chloroflexota bacterium]
MKQIRRVATTMLGVIIVLLVSLGLITVVGGMRGINIESDGDTLTVTDPRLEAEAEAIRIESETNARKGAAEAARLESLAEQEQIETAALAAAAPALVVRDLFLAIGTGIAGVVLLIGLAIALVALINKRTLQTYPNSAGQYPVIATKSLFGITYHDPNRALNSGTVVTHPTPLSALIKSLFRRQGWDVENPTVEAPQLASEPAQLALSSQSQGVQLMTAATRQQWPGNSGGRSVDESVRLAQTVADSTSARMPTIQVVESPEETAQFVQLLEGEIEE